MKFQRKQIRLKEFSYIGNFAYSVTICTYDKQNYFTENNLISYLISELRTTADIFSFSVYAYCFMPNHLHLLLVAEGFRPPEENGTLKRSATGAIPKNQNNACSGGLQTANKHGVGINPDATSLIKFIERFKQKTGFYFKQKYGKNLWQKSFYEHILRREEILENVALYILNNPVRKNLVDDFRKYPYLGSFAIDIGSLKPSATEMDYGSLKPSATENYGSLKPSATKDKMENQGSGGLQTAKESPSGLQTANRKWNAKAFRYGKLWKSKAFRYIVFLIFNFTFLVSNLEAANWRAFRRDAGRTGYAYEQAYPPLTFRWYYQAGGKIVSSPVVVNGIVYVGSDDGKVYALDASSGTLKWEFSTGGGINSSPAISGGVVYIASRDGNLYALDALTGTKKWQFATGGQDVSSPVVKDGIVFSASGYPNRYLYALDTRTGNLLWKYETGQFIYSSPAVDDGAVYIGSNDGKYYALLSSSGTLKWQPYPTLGGIYLSSVATYKGVVYAVPGFAEQRVFAFDAQTGNIKWTSEDLGDFPTNICSPAVAEGVVYVGSGCDPHRIYALDAETGATKWVCELGRPIEYAFTSSPAIANDVLYVGSGEEGSLYAIDVATGGIVWRENLGSGIVSSPAVANGIVYVGTIEGIIFAYQTTRITAMSSPDEEKIVGGNVEIKGTVKNPQFVSYKLEYGAGQIPGEWKEIATGNTEIENNTLGIWDTANLQEGLYALRLTVTDSNPTPKRNSAVVYFTLNNATTSQYVDAGLGGTVATLDGTEIVFEPGALSESTTVYIWPVLPGEPEYYEEGIPANCKATTYVRKFELANPEVKFNKLVTIKIPHPTSGFNKEYLRIYWWDGTKKEWRMVNTSEPKPLENRVWAKVSHFSIYRVIEYAPSGDIISEGEVYTYPNPAKKVDQLYFKFKITDKADVKIDIYNIAGELVGHLEKSYAQTDAGIVQEISWDIKNIASGVYIYRIEAKSALQTKAVKKKLAIIH